MKLYFFCANYVTGRCSGTTVSSKEIETPEEYNKIASDISKQVAKEVGCNESNVCITSLSLLNPS